MKAYTEDFYPDTFDFFKIENNYNFIKYLFYIFFISVTGISISTIIVSLILFNDYKKYYNNNYHSDSNSDSDSDTNSECDNYEDKYIDEYNELSSRSIDDDEIILLKNTFISDKTPKGIIKMCYDVSNNAFSYYIDNKEISNKYLETTARLYVIEYNCKNLYINYHDEYNKALEIQKAKIIERQEKIEKQKQLEESKKNSVFARFRSYNSTIDTDSSNLEDIPIIPEKNNIFIYKGKLSDWNEYMKYINNDNDNDNDNDFEDLDYASFKKLEENKKFV